MLINFFTATPHLVIRQTVELRAMVAILRVGATTNWHFSNHEKVRDASNSNFCQFDKQTFFIYIILS